VPPLAFAGAVQETLDKVHARVRVSPKPKLNPNPNPNQLPRSNAR